MRAPVARPPSISNAAFEAMLLSLSMGSWSPLSRRALLDPLSSRKPELMGSAAIPHRGMGSGDVDSWFSHSLIPPFFRLLLSSSICSNCPFEIFPPFSLSNSLTSLVSTCCKQSVVEGSCAVRPHRCLSRFLFAGLMSLSQFSSQLSRGFRTCL